MVYLAPLGRFHGVENILKVYEGERLLRAGLMAAIGSLFLVPMANVPLFVMHSDSPVLLTYYLNERNVTELWDHSLFYWILIGFDSLWLSTVLKYFVLLILLVGNIGCGMLLMLKSHGQQQERSSE